MLTTAPLASEIAAASSAPPPADVWHPVPDQASVQDGQLFHVVWTGTRFMAGGEGGAFLASSDGLVWDRLETSCAISRLSGLVVGAGGVIALGALNEGLPASCFSPDGVTWTARADALPVISAGTGAFDVTDAVATPDGWLAVGQENIKCAHACAKSWLMVARALVWTSSDGHNWRQVPDQAVFAEARMTGVTRFDRGFVAVGQTASNDAVAWTSTNGSTWRRVRASVFAYAGMLSIAAGHGIVVAVGVDGASAAGGLGARAWWSLDGRTWAQASGHGFSVGQLRSVIATSDGFLAVGPSRECRGAIWASSDGRAWQCVIDAPSDPTFTGWNPYAVAASSLVEVAVGLGGGPRGDAWRRPLP